MVKNALSNFVGRQHSDMQYQLDGARRNVVGPNAADQEDGRPFWCVEPSVPQS